MTQEVIVKPTAWRLDQLWNAVAFRENKPLIARDYIYASEIGAPYIDRFYKMKAVKYTNPPNNRSLRKFLSGNIWEHVVKQILIACGVYKHEEVKVDATPYKNCLSVHGRLDFKAGGYVDERLACVMVSELNLPDFLQKIAEKIIASLAGGFLEEKILELKAVSTFAMDMVERSRSAIPQHTLQAYHYQRNGKIPAEICYVCKDDCRMAQFGIDAAAAEILYKEDIKQMSYYYKKNEVPPPAPLSKFDITLGKFSKNLGVEYSPYLTMVYGFKDPDEYRDNVKFIDKWNRTLTRAALVKMGAKTPTGKPIAITTKNIEVMQEINKSGFRFDECLKCKLAVGLLDDEENAE